MRGHDIGIIGLGVMGRNLALNMADHGFAVVVYNRTESATREVAAMAGPRRSLYPVYSLEQFAEALARPRRIMIMVKAGQAVDDVIGALEGLLGPGDIVMDGGNAHFSDTAVRAKRLAVAGIRYAGVGISGGERGARTGPSIMAGGSEDTYDAVRPVFEAIAARVDGRPCAVHVGPDPAGHYVKMVHNGIEYGLMQLIADTYIVMRQGLGLSNDDLAAVYAEWNGVELESYLVEITAKIFLRSNGKTGGRLIDVIRGDAGQLGTGMWASQSAMDLHVPAPNVDVAVAMRNLASLVDERRAVAAPLAPASAGLPPAYRAGAGTDGSAVRGMSALRVEDVRDALHAGMVATFAQGFAHLQVASAALGLRLTLADVASVWRGGCIIRAALLRDIEAAYARLPTLPNLLQEPAFSEVVVSRRAGLVSTVQAAMSSGLPVPGLMTALAYVDALRAPWLPSNLIQAQRDYFGAHTYRRTDVDGVFHTDWAGEEGRS